MQYCQYLSENSMFMHESTPKYSTLEFGIGKKLNVIQISIKNIKIDNDIK